MKRDDASSKLQLQLDTIPAVQRAGRKSAQFVEWNRTTTVVIAKIFGSDAEHVHHFSQIRYDPVRSNSMTATETFTRAYEEGLNAARGVLTSMIAELRDLTSPSADPTAGPSDKPVFVKAPTMFIGSSVEGLPVAEALQVNLEHTVDATIWHQGVFGLSTGTLETLVDVAATFDFAALVLTPDDVSFKRDVVGNAPRDNVLFELGLFIGALGRARTYIVHPRGAIQLPSDLAGITPATFSPNRQDGNLLAALGPVATKLKAEILKLGPRHVS